MRAFEINIEVTKEDLDDLNHVNNVRYVQWVQEVAKKHWEHDASKSVLKDYFWVMLNHYIEYKKPAFLDDTLYLKTFIEDYKAATCTRIVEISHGDQLIARSKTTWCLMNAQTKRPARITKEIINLFT